MAIADADEWADNWRRENEKISMKYFIGSVGKPKSDYIEDNLQRIIKNKGFVLHQDTAQKGAFENISVGDIIILKYNKMFIAYGKINKIEISEDEEWNHWTFVDCWNFNNEDNHKIGIDRYGIDDNTIGGGKYGTVKTITDSFGFQKINEINNHCDLFNEISKKIICEKMNENVLKIKNLLSYKKQIILQGPPGTGKTKLAKELADKILNKNEQGKTAKDLIEEFFQSPESIKSDNEGFSKKLNEFYSAFPKDQIMSMEIDDYCIGKGNRTNFCWWIEVGLSSYGKFSPGQSGNYVVYFSGKANDYVVKKFDEPVATIFPRVKDAINRLVNKKDIPNALEYFGESFILKILNSYYPNEYFPINGKKALENANKLFAKETKRKNNFELNKMLFDEFYQLKNKFNSDKTPLDFMHFLFTTFNLNEDGLQYEDNKFSVAKRKPTIIQFHPSYTYEDFVRGIVAETNDKNINYITQNKTLAEIANEALENQYSDYVLIIDEINRANLSSVLGELIYVLEYRYNFNDSEEKQNESKVHSLYSLTDKETDAKNNELVLPENLYIIGTMNTADRSVGHIDYAIRRRFAFVEVLPKNLKEQLAGDFKEAEFIKVANLFVKNYDSTIDYSKESKIEKSEHLMADFDPKDVWLGHSYFIQHYEKNQNGNDLKDKPIDFDLRIQYEIKPILEEYIKDGILKESAREVIDQL